MFDFSAYEYDFRTNRFLVDGEAMIFHCHHYNCFLQRSIQDAEYIDSAPILVGAAAEVVFAQLRGCWPGRRTWRPARPRWRRSTASAASVSSISAR